MLRQGLIFLLSLLLCSAFPLVSGNMVFLLVTSSQCQASALKVWLLSSQGRTKHWRAGLAALLLTQGWCRQWVLLGEATPPGNSQQLTGSGLCINGSQSKFAFCKRQNGHQSHVHLPVRNRLQPFTLPTFSMPAADLGYTSRSCCLFKEKRRKIAFKIHLIRYQFSIIKVSRSKFKILRVRISFIK